mmetsp:Transcript_14762/g.34290  ORF Transcript_14762/g.34290 Transcript_14762/m.34290 type:complete len:349 (+) Transcript_14762:257-1303(+)
MLQRVDRSWSIRNANVATVRRGIETTRAVHAANQKGISRFSHLRELGGGCGGGFWSLPEASNEDSSQVLHADHGDSHNDIVVSVSGVEIWFHRGDRRVRCRDVLLCGIVPPAKGVRRTHELCKFTSLDTPHRDVARNLRSLSSGRGGNAARCVRPFDTVVRNEIGRCAFLGRRNENRGFERAGRRQGPFFFFFSGDRRRVGPIADDDEGTAAAAAPRGTVPQARRARLLLAPEHAQDRLAGPFLAGRVLVRVRDDDVRNEHRSVDQGVRAVGAAKERPHLSDFLDQLGPPGFAGRPLQPGDSAGFLRAPDGVVVDSADTIHRFPAGEGEGRARSIEDAIGKFGMVVNE